jgi:hypothetical protein
MLERKLGGTPVEIWNDLASARNPFRGKALEELAKHYEHREKDPGRALEMTRSAREHADSPELRQREERLKKRMAANERRCTRIKQKRAADSRSSASIRG